MKEFICHNLEETQKLAAEIAAQANGGDIFALQGDLGAGKTTFTQFFAKSLGIEKSVTSPTFVVMKMYEVSGNSEIDKLIHIDCYRFETLDDARSIGLGEYLDDQKAVILIEWPERIWPMIQDRAKMIQFATVSETERKISL